MAAVKRAGTHKSITSNQSAFSKYRSVIVGSESILFLIYFEFCMILGVTPGALGLVLRKIFWKKLFLKCGSGVNFGYNIQLRNPKKIRLGNNVIISEYTILDGRNEDLDTAIIIKDNVMISSNVLISSKGGYIEIGNNAGIGAQTIIQSLESCPVIISENVLIGPRCYLVGGSNYNTDDLDIPIYDQGLIRDNGITVEDNCWLGGNVTVLSGVKIEKGSIAAAGAVINKSIPPFSVCGGIPAKIIKSRLK
jgi:acetyltransferase-like isoleucine patch superfamily enzyme